MGCHDPQKTTLKSGERCLVRTAEARDAEGLIAVARATLAGPRSAFSVTTLEEFTLTAQAEVAWIEKHRTAVGWIVLVAEVDECVIGLINFQNGLRSRIAHRGAFGMSVHPDWRGRGVGDALLGTLMRWACEHPLIEKVGLAVIEGNDAAIGLYRKHGFVEEGRRRGEIRYGQDSYADDILMYCSSRSTQDPTAR